MSTTKTLPPELLEKVLFWALAQNTRAQYLNLLLTSRAVNQTTQYVANKSALYHVGDRYGSLAASMLFTNVPSQNLLRCLPQIKSVAKGAEQILEAALPRLERLQQSGQQNLTAATTTPTSDLSNILPTLKLGLYIIEATRFHSDPTPDDIRQMLANLPPYGVLIVRMTSILLAALFGNFLCAEIDAVFPSRAGSIGLVGNDSLLIRGVELELLSNGCQTIVDIITSKLRMPEDRYYYGENGTFLTAIEWRTTLYGRKWDQTRDQMRTKMMHEEREMMRAMMREERDMRRAMREMRPDRRREMSREITETRREITEIRREMSHDYQLPNPDIDIARKNAYDIAVANTSTENSRRETAKRQAIETMVRKVNLANSYGWMTPGRVRDKQKTVVMSRRIMERFGEELPLYSARPEDISELQALITTEIGEKTESLVLQEMKAVIET